MCCICVAVLPYLSPSLCWSLHCGLHSWSKTTHSVCWHQLPWQELKGVNKHRVSKPANRGKKQLTSQSFGCADKQSQSAHTSEICGAWAALPGKIAQGREGNVQTEPPCQQLMCQSDHCTSGSRWAWPGDNSGSSNPRSKVLSYKPPHWLHQHPHRSNREASRWARIIIIS